MHALCTPNRVVAAQGSAGTEVIGQVINTKSTIMNKGAAKAEWLTSIVPNDGIPLHSSRGEHEQARHLCMKALNAVCYLHINHVASNRPYTNQRQHDAADTGDG